VCFFFVYFWRVSQSDKCVQAGSCEHVVCLSELVQSLLNAKTV